MIVDASRIEKLTKDSKKAQKLLGDKGAKKLMRCIIALEAAANLSVFAPPNTGAYRCHALKGRRSGQFSMWITGSFRLIFVASRGDDKGKMVANWKDITEIQLLEVVDYHD